MEIINVRKNITGLNIDSVDNIIISNLSRYMPSSVESLYDTPFYYIKQLYKYIEDNKQYIILESRDKEIQENSDVDIDIENLHKSNFNILVSSVIKRFTEFNNNSINEKILEKIHMGVINTLFNIIIYNKYNVKKLFDITSFNESYKFGNYCPGCVCISIKEFEPSGYHGSAADTNTYSLEYYFNEDQLKTDIIKEIECKEITQYITNTDITDFNKHKELYNNFNTNLYVLKLDIKKELKEIENNYKIKFSNLD